MLLPIIFCYQTAVVVVFSDRRRRCCDWIESSNTATVVGYEFLLIIIINIIEYNIHT